LFPIRNRTSLKPGKIVEPNVRWHVDNTPDALVLILVNAMSAMEMRMDVVSPCVQKGVVFIVYAKLLRSVAVSQTMPGIESLIFVSVREVDRYF